MVINDTKLGATSSRSPRQVGKTTLAKSLPGTGDGYLNWGVDERRGRILERNLPDADLWAFDEIHKYRHWRNWLKGLYDARQPNQRILVTGSGRLDLYRFGGDSLQGRYQLLRMHPFSFAELELSTSRELRDLPLVEVGALAPGRLRRRSGAALFPRPGRTRG